MGLTYYNTSTLFERPQGVPGGVHDPRKCRRGTECEDIRPLNIIQHHGLYVSTHVSENENSSPRPCTTTPLRAWNGQAPKSEEHKDDFGHSLFGATAGPENAPTRAQHAVETSPDDALA